MNGNMEVKTEGLVENKSDQTIDSDENVSDGQIDVVPKAPNNSSGGATGVLKARECPKCMKMQSNKKCSKCRKAKREAGKNVSDESGEFQARKMEVRNQLRELESLIHLAEEHLAKTEPEAIKRALYEQAEAMAAQMQEKLEERRLQLRAEATRILEEDEKRREILLDNARNMAAEANKYSDDMHQLMHSRELHEWTVEEIQAMNAEAMSKRKMVEEAYRKAAIRVDPVLECDMEGILEEFEKAFASIGRGIPTDGGLINRLKSCTVLKTSVVETGAPEAASSEQEDGKSLEASGGAE